MNKTSQHQRLWNRKKWDSLAWNRMPIDSGDYTMTILTPMDWIDSWSITLPVENMMQS